MKFKAWNLLCLGLLATSIAATADARPAKSKRARVSQSVCQEPSRPPRMISTFNVQRAWPESPIPQEYNHDVAISVSVSSNGEIERITSTVSPITGFHKESAEREMGRMTFEPARRNCQNVPGVFHFKAKFRTSDE